MPWLRLRTIVLEDDAAGEVDAANSQFARFAEAWEGLTWLLARDPEPNESFKTAYNGVVFMLYGVKGDRAADIPDMWLVYQYNDDEVVIHGVNAIEAGDPEAEEL